MQPLLDADITKDCNVCKETKPLSEYNPNKECKYGVVGTCKLCSNARVGQWYKNNRTRRQEAANIANQKRKRLAVNHFGDKCHDCERTYPQYVYQFHHLDPTQKDYNPSASIQNGMTAMWRELAKCVMLCANCHMIRHHGKDKE